MKKIEKNFSLKNLNTFNLESRCARYVEISSIEDLDQLTSPPLLSEIHDLDIKILGGGSNILLPRFLNSLVIKNRLNGIERLPSKESSFFVRVKSGENWHQFVTWCLRQKIYGLENLALIPGTVGAAPIQNIGAYGVEVNKFIYEVSGIQVKTKELIKLKNEDCDFSYRHSIFKSSKFADFLITDVIFKFPQQNKIESSYGELAQHFNTHPLSPEALYEKVIEIRSRKLPSLDTYPNVGSFFKNPMVTMDHFNSLKQSYPQLVGHPQIIDYHTQELGKIARQNIKLSAGQLIELCGWKGKKVDSVGFFERQALVMINYGDATIESVLNLASLVRDNVNKKFAVTLEIEPLIWK